MPTAFRVGMRGCVNRSTAPGASSAARARRYLPDVLRLRGKHLGVILAPLQKRLARAGGISAHDSSLLSKSMALRYVRIALRHARYRADTGPTFAIDQNQCRWLKMATKMIRRFPHWLYPELALFPSRNARRDADGKMARLMLTSPVFWTCMLTLPFIDVFLITRATPFISRIFTGKVAQLLVGLALGLTLALGAATLCMIVARRNRIRRMLRECLREQGIPICITCGYDLTGLASKVCPECGQPHGLARANSPQRGGGM